MLWLFEVLVSVTAEMDAETTIPSPDETDGICFKPASSIVKDYDSASTPTDASTATSSSPSSDSEKKEEKS